MIGRRGVLAAAGAAAIIRPGHASLPPGPFRILVGFSAGGSADIIARVLARILALTAAIWHNDKTAQPVKRSLTAYDH